MKTYFEKILIPVDGSHTCLHAQELVAEIAKRYKSKVTVIHVVSHDFMYPTLGSDYQVTSSIVDEITNFFLQKGRRILSEAEALFREEGLDVEAKILEYADPAEAILRIAEDNKYDLIAMGSRGETEAEVFSLGSVAEKVSRHAECPVLMVKQKTVLSKILVAIDGSEAAAEALRYTVQLARRHKAEITLLNVGESKLFGFKPDIAREAGEHILSNAVAKVERLNGQTRLEFGNPAETIIDIAEEEKYDLIVLGSRGLSNVRRFLLGSVSDDVSHHAKCSVLIVR